MSDNIEVKTKKSSPLLYKIIAAMISLAVLQVLVFGLAMIFSGEFASIKKFSYNNVSEKTENRSNYVENLFNQKTSLVYWAAMSVENAAKNVLSKRGQEIEAIRSDKETNNEILGESVETLMELIRRDLVNDAFLILDTGNLYDSSGKHCLNGIYIRDTDVNENSVSDYSDIYMEVGSSDISHALSLPLDYGWSRYFAINDEESFGFYFDTIRDHERFSSYPAYSLGHWSGFSTISVGSQESIKYTMPLVSPDGKAFGVIGIGLLKKTVLAAIPANDFFDESACYILGADFGGDGVYETLLSSGPAYNRLVNEKTTLDRERPVEYGLFDLSAGGADCIGSIHDMTLYTAGSPYRAQKWALISVADKSKTLKIYNTLVMIFSVSVAITLAAGIVFAVFMSRTISRPVTKMVSELDESRNNHTIVEFSRSGIIEIDNLAAAISELQVVATEYASRVSKIITMSGSGIGVFMYDFRNGTVFVGESLIKLLSFRALPNKDVTISSVEFRRQLEIIDSENLVLNMGIFRPESASVVETLELSHEDKEKGTRWFKFTLTRDTTNVVGLVQDITDAVTEKKQIAKVKDDEYTSKLLQANAALSDAYVMAKQANNAKTDFLSRMSHDIRTPMNAIIGMTTIAKSSIDNSEKTLDCLNKIDVSGRYLLSLINEVLDMSKIESGKFVLSEEKFSVTQLISNIGEIIKPAVKEKEQEFSIERGEFVHETVIGDETRLQQAFMNILSNAVKYTQTGGKIVFSACEKPLEQTKVGCFEFTFTDNGIGMSEEFLNKLYEPFERASDVRVSKENGTGLGMAITKNIIEMMDGDISVKSKEGEGTTFVVTVFLKLAEEESAAQRSADEKSGIDAIKSRDYTGRSVLLVEDNDINREIAAEILEMAGLSVESARDGREALEMFIASEVGKYSMIFMDVQMPVMNGYEATMAIRALERPDSGLPIAAMTANAFAEDVQDAKNAGMSEHIAKPLDLDKLTKILDKWLRE